MENNPQTTRRLLDMAILQSAAESYLHQWTGRGGDNPDLARILLAGATNLRNVSNPDPGSWDGGTGLTAVQAARFLGDPPRVSIVDHHANDDSGFSATLFYDSQAGKVVISFRSTEYETQSRGGDWERDGGPGADGDISNHGFALAQLTAMEEWFAEMTVAHGDLLDGSKPIAVTGYSLGGHLSTAFALMHPRIGGVDVETFNFNAAGMGSFGTDTASQRMAPSGAALTNLIRLYKQLMAWDGTDGFDNIDAALYTAITGKTLSDIVNSPDYLSSSLYAIETTGANGEPYGARYQAVMAFLDDITNGTVRIGLDQTREALQRFATSGFDPEQLVFTAGEVTTWADHIHQVFGHGNFFDPQMVANSGFHAKPLTELGIAIEDLPMSRSYGILEMYDNMTQHNEQLLNEARDAVEEFGETHSITPVIDSLMVIDLLQQLDPSFTNQQFSKLLGAVSNRVEILENRREDAEVSVLGQILRGFGGEMLYESDALENLVSHLSQIFLGDALPALQGAFDDARGFANRTYRAQMHERIQQITESDAFAATMNNTDVLSLVGKDTEALINLARNNIGVRFALANGLPFALIGLAADAAYALRNTDGDLDNSAWSDQYLADRASFLEWQLRYQTGQEDDGDSLWRVSAGVQDFLVSPLIEPNLGDKQFDDDWETSSVDGDWRYLTVGRGLRDENGDGARDDIGFRISNDFPGFADDRVISFGDGRENVLVGEDNDDRLYGEAGDDTLAGEAGQDHLEGGRGNDVLRGGEGSDELLGGEGNDTYVAGQGSDWIEDSDGAGSVVWLDGTVVRGREAGANPDNWVRLSDTRFWDRANDFHYELTSWGDDQVLIITSPSRGDGNGRVAIQNWHDGDLGIHLQNVPVPPRVPVLATEGNDRLGFASNTDPTLTQSRVIDGLGGNDLISGGFGHDRLLGGAGDDFLTGGSGVDELYGGDGNDFIVADGSPANTYVTSPNDPAIPAGSQLFSSGEHWWVSRRQFQVGNQMVDEYRNYYDPMTVVDPAGADYADFVDGGAGNDVIFLEAGNDGAVGGTGNDVIVGGTGHDVIEGGQGNDTLLGDGADVTQSGVVEFGNGNDSLSGGDGDDHLEGGAGNDTLSGDNDADFLAGQAGRDMLNGGSGNDQIWGDNFNTVTSTGTQLAEDVSGVDEVDAGEGNDVVHGGGGDDRLRGGDGADELYGDNAILGALDQYRQFDGRDRLEGDAGNDILFGMGNGDRLEGGTGDDILFGDHADIDASGHGNDELYGQEGNDQLSGNGGIDRLDGGSGDDQLWGGAGNDVLIGGAGSDQLHGGEGNDEYVIDLSSGTDSIWELGDANAGTDTIRIKGVDPASVIVGVNREGVLYFQAPAGGAVLLVGLLDNTQATHTVQFENGAVWTMATLLERLGSAEEEEYGDTSNNVIVGGSADNTFDGGLGDDTLLGGSGNDVIRGGVENGDTFTGTDNDTLVGGDGNDELDGGEGSDRLDGGAGNDLIKGGYGADNLIGGAGDDMLYAGWREYFGGRYWYDAADDVLNGGAGNDHLEGGLGTNTYYFERGAGIDEIRLTLADPFQADLGTSSEQSVLRFGTGVTASDLNFVRDGSDLIIRYGDDRITILDYATRADAVVNFTFTDGSSLSSAQNADLTWSTGTAGPDTASGSPGNDTLSGLGGDDRLYGNGGDDLLIGGRGRDTLQGGAGNDTYRYGSADGVDMIGGSAVGADVLELGAGISRSDISIYKGPVSAGAADFYIVFNATGNYIRTTWNEGQTDQAIDLIRFADGSTMTAVDANGLALPANLQLEFSGSNGNQYANSIYGADNSSVTTLSGGAGDDVYYFNADWGQIYGTPVEAANGGNDTVVTDKYNWTLSDNVENLVAGFNGNLSGIRNFTGNALDNIIDVSQAGNQNFRLDGGAGADVLIGGTTNDTYVIDNVGDVIVESSRYDSIDTVEASISYSIADSLSLESITLVGGTASTATGNAQANRLDGSTSSAANTLSGGDGDDYYVVGAGDVVVESVGRGNDTVLAMQDTQVIRLVDYQNVENVTLDVLVDADLVVGNDGANVMTGSAFEVEMRGGGGDDTLYGGDPGGNSDRLFGEDGNDVLQAGNGNDLLDGGAGNDTLRGGTGNDVYYVDTASDLIVEDQNAGSDEVFSTGDYVLGDNVERLALLGTAQSGTGNQLRNHIFGTQANNTLSGMGGDDELHADGGADTLDGGTGSDRLIGGAGADTYVYRLGDGDDQIEETQNTAGERDVLRLGAGIGTADVTVRRSQRTGELWVEIAGSRIDIVDSSGASLVEEIRLDDGTVWNVDAVTTINNDEPLALSIPDQPAILGRSFSYTLSNAFFDEDALSFAVEDLPSWLTFNAQTNTISGTVPSNAALSSIIVHATDTAGQTATTSVSLVPVTAIDGTSAANTLTGTSARDALFGLAGNDVLDGRQDADFMYGGTGDDTYTVDSTEDAVIELAGEGNDQINASVSIYGLAENVEKVQLTGTSSLDAYGNALNNTVIGNSGNNELYGEDGNDSLQGNSGNDRLVGGVGNDSLDGGVGSDYMEGGEGNDTYVVNVTGDEVVESESGGIDLVQASITYELGDNLENLSLAGGTSALNGTGNAADNELTGNNGNNRLTGLEGNDTLDGGLGNDTMIGGVGDDTYVVNVTGDVVTELAGEGIDTVKSGITLTLLTTLENLTLTGTNAINGTGNTGANVLVGNSNTNALRGYAGNDALDGAAGADTLTGDTGNDTYQMARGYGSDTVVENDPTAGNTDVARFLSGVSYDQLWFARPSGSNNLEITIIGTSDKLVIKDWYLGAQYRVEEIRTVDGNRVLSAANVQALVTEMAKLSKPALGQTTLSASYRTSLDPVFASTWSTAPGLQQTFTRAVCSGIPDVREDDTPETPLAGDSPDWRSLLDGIDDIPRWNLMDDLFTPRHPNRFRDASEWEAATIRHAQEFESQYVQAHRLIQSLCSYPPNEVEASDLGEAVAPRTELVGGSSVMRQDSLAEPRLWRSAAMY